jgi:hypothetical protein
MSDKSCLLGVPGFKYKTPLDTSALNIGNCILVLSEK